MVAIRLLGGWALSDHHACQLYDSRAVMWNGQIDLPAEPVPEFDGPLFIRDESTSGETAIGG